MLGYTFHHNLIRKYVAIFGTLFNDVFVMRTDGVEETAQHFQVPISYGPREKFLAMIKQKPDSKRQAIILPRMSFEITGLQYDAARRDIRSNKIFDTATKNIVYSPVPYNINFQLNIMVKQSLDGTKIVEQILPFFVPDWTIEAKLLDDSDKTWDIPIVYQGIQHQDVYEADFIERRVQIWTLDFVMKAFLLGPTSQRKQIKFVDVTTYGNMTQAPGYQRVTVQPGLTTDGLPTQDEDLTIPYTLIEEEDDWAYIVKVVDVV